MQKRPKRRFALWTQLPNATTAHKIGYRKARYEYKAKLFKRKHFLCQSHKKVFPLGWAFSTDIHHTSGRVGDLLMDDTKWLAVCRECHDWIHTNIQQARQLGLICPRGQWGKQNGR